MKLEKNTGKALKEYQKLIAIDPKNHEVWYNMGFAYDELEQYEKAIDCYETAVKHKPDYHNAWNNIGHCLQ